MRILHITNWYYSKEEPNKVPFIKEHVRSLEKYCDNQLMHIEVQDDGSSFWSWSKGDLSGFESFRILKCKKIPWRIKEKLSSWLLLKTFKELDVNHQFDVINIHTAYPLCSSIKRIKAYLNIPLVFTEHWTAFSFNFNLPETSPALDRIRRIYHENIPIISVSKALSKDIKTFVHRPHLKVYVVPNVVPEEIFYFQDAERHKEPVFFMVNFWREIKSPFEIFEAFRELLYDYPQAQLRVGGYGPLWPDMEQYVAHYDLKNSIKLIGRLEKTEIAYEMNHCTAFVHAARFETFSVVTAEALMCGTPVAVSDLPCIRELINIENGVLVRINGWKEVLIRLAERQYEYSRNLISENAICKFSKESVGCKYYLALEEITK